MKYQLPRFWVHGIFGILLLFVQSEVARALPTESCPQQSQDFSSLKPKMAESKSRNICASVSPTKVSKYEKTDSCTEIYSIAEKSVLQYETQKKTGCTNLQQLVTKAQSCNPSGANQVECFNAAAQAYEFASGLERSQTGAIQQAVEAMRRAKTASESATSTYANHQSAMNTAISWSQRKFRDMAEEHGRVARQELLNATSILRNEPRSGITGEVNASDGGKRTILEYQKAVKDYIAVHQRANAFADDFLAESEKVKKILSQRISQFDQAAKDARASAANGSTAKDPNSSPEAGGSGISGISMPSMSPPAEEPNKDSSASPGIASKQEKSSRSPTNLANQDRNPQTGKNRAGATNNKRVNRESISFEKTKQVVAKGGASKNSPRFQSPSKGPSFGSGRSSFESKGTALLGMLKEQPDPSKFENTSVNAKTGEAVPESFGDDGSAETDGQVADNEDSQEELPDSTLENAEELSEGEGEEGRDLASQDENGSDASSEIDLSTSLFDRVNRKLFQAYRTGKVIYEE